MKIDFIFVGLAFGLASVGSAAWAQPGTTTGNINIRTGPGVHHNRIGSVPVDNAVDILECRGNWCRIEHGSDKGWVSRNFLKGPDGNKPPHGVFASKDSGNDAACQTKDVKPCPKSDAGSVKARKVSALPAAQVCFYSQPHYGGEHFCVPKGKSADKIDGFWNDRIASLQIHGRMTVEICRDKAMSGGCVAVNSSKPDLAFWSKQVSSYKAY